MAIQVPRIKKFQAQAPESVGRQNFTAPNDDEGAAIVRQQIGKTAGSLADAYSDYDAAVTKQEQQARELKATELQNIYETKVKGELARIGTLKGDMTSQYKDLDANMQKWQGEISKDLGDENLTALYQQKVMRSNNRLYQQRTLQQAKQFYEYQDETVKSTVKLRQDDAVQNSAILDARNPGTFVPLQQSIDAIEKARAAQGEMNGFKIKYEDGQAIYEPAVETAIKNDIGDAIKPIVKTLNGAGKAKEAQAIIEKYGRWLNADDRDKLVSENRQTGIKNEALVVVSQIQASGPAGLAAIDARADLTPEVKEKAREIYDTRERQLDSARTRKSRMVLNRVMTDIQSRQDADAKNPDGTPTAYVSAADFREKSPYYKNNKDLLTPAQWKNIEAMIAGSPTESDSKVLAEVYNKIADGSIEDLTPEELLDYKTKLSKQDFNKVDRIFLRGNQPESVAQKRAHITWATKEMRNKIGAATIDDEPLFPRTANGRFLDPDDNVIVADINNRLSDFITESPNATESSIKQKQAELLAEAIEKKNKARNSNPILNFFRKNKFDGGAVAPTATPAPTAAAVVRPQAQQAVKPSATLPTKSVMSTWQVKDWKKAYMAENPGKAPPNGNQLSAFKQKKLAAGK